MKQGSTNNNMLFLRGSRFIISPEHDCTDWNVSWFFTVPSVRIVPQILFWPLQYSFQLILDKLSCIVWVLTTSLNYNKYARMCLLILLFAMRFRLYLLRIKFCHIIIHKNGSAGGFPGFESAFVEWFNLYWCCKITEFMFLVPLFVL